jgi:hypothetical protein
MYIFKYIDESWMSRVDFQALINQPTKDI